MTATKVAINRAPVPAFWATIVAEGLGYDHESARSSTPPEEAFVQQTMAALAGQYLARIMERQSDYFEAFLREELSHLVNRVVERVVDQIAEPLEEGLALQTNTRSERSWERPTPALLAPARDKKAEVLPRIRLLQGEGLSLQAIANRLNAEGMPTLSGKGSWKKGTLSNALKES
jgi:hypothetical protein